MINADKTYNYYQIVGTIDGQKDCLFGSYNREDVQWELLVEEAVYLIDGYKNLKIEKSITTVAPDPEVYPELYSKGGLDHV